MVIARIPREATRHTLRQLTRHCGPLSEATTTEIQAGRFNPAVRFCTACTEPESC